jgi:hypothetical protein
MNIARQVLGFVLLALFGPGLSALGWAEVPRGAAVQPDTLQAVLDRIHEHSATEEWKKEGFKDDEIEKWLDKVVESVAKAAEFPDLKLPTRLSEVKPGNPMPGRPMLKVLMVGKDVRLRDIAVRDSIVLADGNVELSRIDGCVIVARGAVTAHASSANSVIVAGALVKLGQYDGNPGNTTNGSLIVTRGWADLGAAYGTMVVAPEGITVGRSEGAIFINSPVPQPAVLLGGVPAVARDRGSRSVKAPDLALEALPSHPLGQKVNVTGVLRGEAPAGAGAFSRVRNPTGCTALVFRFEGKKYVADMGEPIVDEAGHPVPALRGWKLGAIGHGRAILSGPDADAVARLGDK